MKEGVCNTIFDHSSIPKTLEKIFDMNTMTDRDKKANGLESLITNTLSNGKIRTSCFAGFADVSAMAESPEEVTRSTEANTSTEPTEAEIQAEIERMKHVQPPDKDNLRGVLNTLLTTLWCLEVHGELAQFFLLKAYT